MNMRFNEKILSTDDTVLMVRTCSLSLCTLTWWNAIKIIGASHGATKNMEKHRTHHQVNHYANCIRNRYFINSFIIHEVELMDAKEREKKLKCTLNSKSQRLAFKMNYLRLFVAVGVSPPPRLLFSNGICNPLCSHDPRANHDECQLLFVNQHYFSFHFFFWLLLFGIASMHKCTSTRPPSRVYIARNTEFSKHSTSQTECRKPAKINRIFRLRLSSITLALQSNEWGDWKRRRRWRWWWPLCLSIYRFDDRFVAPCFFVLWLPAWKVKNGNRIVLVFLFKLKCFN